MDICIYHGSCLDGMAAAWIVRKAMGEMTFWRAQYTQEPPDVTGKDVIMVDFSYKRHVLIGMAAVAKSILIIDHHKTAQEDLVDLPSNVTAFFDMNHSGCVMTWRHFYNEAPPPKLLAAIEDRDLWRFKLEDTKPICASLYSYHMEMAEWDKIMQPEMYARHITDGEALLRAQARDIEAVLRQKLRMIKLMGYEVPIVNCSNKAIISEVGHRLARNHPFCVIYYDNGEALISSLRSDEHIGIDVSEIAKMFGGGGHRNAAGFSIAIGDGTGLVDAAQAIEAKQKAMEELGEMKHDCRGASTKSVI